MGAGILRELGTGRFDFEGRKNFFILDEEVLDYSAKFAS